MDTLVLQSLLHPHNCQSAKGQIKLKADWRAIDSPKKMNEQSCSFCQEKQKSKKKKFVYSFFGRISSAPIYLSDIFLRLEPIAGLL